MKAEVAEPLQRRRLSVLVVDDDPDQRHLMRMKLERSGAAVQAVAKGVEALESLEDTDVVVLDYRLPDMSGLETLEAIRRAGGPAVVIVTGMGSEVVAVEAMRAGAVDYLVKTSGYLEVLPEVVDRAWRHRDLERRAAKLQRLALLVAGAHERSETFTEIVTGARQLTDAGLCALYSVDGDAFDMVAQDGEGQLGEDSLAQGKRAAREGVTVRLDDRLFLSLSRPGEQPLGVLVVARPGGRKFLPEEVELAEAFAGFAGTALWNLRRSEFEQRLIGELSQTLDLRREFINSVSHEFRTPLACIMGFAATLMNHWDRLDPETAQRSIERIRHHTSDLTSLVERLLDFARFERGNFRTEMQNVDLAKAIETSLSDLEPVTEDRPVITEVEPAIVMADPQLVHRVLANLVSNAAKATVPGQQINIRASMADDGSMRVEVTDEGRGLSKDELERAFDPFWRTRRSIQGAERGSGIGLALVKEYVEAMEGTVGGRSEPGSGSTFFFTLRIVQS